MMTTVDEVSSDKTMVNGRRSVAELDWQFDTQWSLFLNHGCIRVCKRTIVCMCLYALVHYYILLSYSSLFSSENYT